MAVIGEMRQLTIGGKTYTLPTYSLPIASSSTLGGIKVGSGLSIDPSTGTLTATGTSITIDTAMSDSSTNAVQNKVIKSYADGLIAALDGGTIGTPGAGKTLTALSQTNGQVSATFSNISITKSQVSDFPTNVSAFTNDAGYTTNTGTVTSVRVQATSPVQSSTSTAQSATLNTTISLADAYGDTKNPYGSKTKNYVLAAPSNAAGAPTFRALVAADIPDLSSIYLTSYTETDPTVPAWAKASSKPTYTASEVGALPDSTVIPTKVSELTNDSGYITSYTDEKLKWTASTSSNTYYPLQSTSTATTSTANTLNSVSFYQYYNTAGGYRRLILGNTTAYTSTGGAYGTIRLYGTGATYYGDLNPGTIGSNSLTANRTWTLPNATGTIALTTDIPTVPTNVSAFTNDAGYLTSYTETDPTVPSWAKASSKPSYTFSEIGSKPTTISGYGITNAYTKTEVDTLISNLPEPMIFKGSLGTGGTITSLPTAAAANEGFTYKVITAGTYASQSAKVGDTFISDGSAWVLIPSGDEPSGTVTSITLTQGSGITISNSGTAITTSGTRTISHGDTSSQASSSNSGRTYIQSITLDDYGHVTGLSTATETVTNTDTKLQVAAITSGTTYYPIVGTGTTAATRQYDTAGFIYVGTNGTTSAVGSAKLTLGNSTASGTANNKQGQLVLYGSTAYAHTISGAPTAARTLTLPDKTGTIALTSDIPTVSYPVTSVNSKTGAVSLTASDVGALASNTTYVSTVTTTAGTHTAISSKSGAVSFNVPTKTSHLTNDSGFTTNTGTVTSVAAAGASNSGITISGSPITTSGTITVGLNLSTAINGLGEGTSPAQLNDYAVVQYAGGGTTTTTYHRRKLSNLIVGKAVADQNGATIDTTYLKLAGGTVTGPVTFGDAVSIDEATIGDLVVNGSGSFTNNLQVNTINGVAVGNGRIFYGTCATAAATVDKVVTCASYDALTVGDVLIVKFDNTNSGAVASLTLNVNGTGAKSIKKLYNYNINNLTNAAELRAEVICEFIYNGTYWILANADYNSTYTVTSVWCNTAAATAAKVTSNASYYALQTGNYFEITMRYANTAASALTLNVGSTGAKTIYINGAVSSASNYTLPAGKYIVYYDGTNYHFRTDGKIPNQVSSSTTTKIFTQASAPTSGMVAGDIWIDTSNLS